MPAAIWLVIFLFRLLFSDDTSTTTGVVGAWLKKRGKVASDVGPDMRSFRGRAGRREWWICIIWSAVAGIFFAAMFAERAPLIAVALASPWIISTLAVNARRLHDLTLSAWWQLVPLAITGAIVAGLVISTSRFHLYLNDATTGAATIAICVVMGAFSILLGAIDGRNAPNAFGEADAVA